MFGVQGEQGYEVVSEGIRIKTLVYGESMLMSEFQLDKGAELPSHRHPQEQTGYLVRGRIRLFVNGEARVLTDGGSWNIPADAVHSAEILEDSRAVEIFTPLREDYLAYWKPAGGSEA